MRLFTSWRRRLSASAHPTVVTRPQRLCEASQKKNRLAQWSLGEVEIFLVVLIYPPTGVPQARLNAWVTYPVRQRSESVATHAARSTLSLPVSQYINVCFLDVLNFLCHSAAATGHYEQSTLWTVVLIFLLVSDKSVCLVSSLFLLYFSAWIFIVVAMSTPAHHL